MIMQSFDWFFPSLLNPISADSLTLVVCLLPSYDEHRARRLVSVRWSHSTIREVSPFLRTLIIPKTKTTLIQYFFYTYAMVMSFKITTTQVKMIIFAGKQNNWTASMRVWIK